MIVPAANATDPDAPTMTSLQRNLDSANSQIADIERQNSEHLRLQALYEETLTDAVEKIRNYVFQQNEYLISMHQHYTQQLQDSRKETISAQLIHQDWQASLSRLDEELKKAVKARDQEKDPFRRRLAALREENRVLRAKVGWEKKDWDSDIDEGEEGNNQEEQAAEARGRGWKGLASMEARWEERERAVANVMGPETRESRDA